MSRNTPQAVRHRARKRALQAIYQWQLTRQEAGEILAQFREQPPGSQFDVGYFESLVRGVIAGADALDEALTPFLDRPPAQIDPVERVILQLAAYELRHRPDVPYRVVLNEAVELAHIFGAEQSHTYINGVLDKAARAWRGAETRTAGR